MPQTRHIERHFTAGNTVRDIVIGMSARAHGALRTRSRSVRRSDRHTHHLSPAVRSWRTGRLPASTSEAQLLPSPAQSNEQRTGGNRPRICHRYLGLQA